MQDSSKAKIEMEEALLTNKPASVGIDLGTTNSVVGVYVNGTVLILKNEVGSSTTPSYVAFTDDERVVGTPAKEQAASNPENTIFDAKRLIGRKFDDDNVQTAMRHWPFKVIMENADNKRPLIQVNYKGELLTFTAEEISAMVLGNLKQTAEAYLGHPVKEAVITVPAHFNDLQRQATCDAAQIAGLKVLRIINEPTAAGITFGGTLDVTVLTVDGGCFDVLATDGEPHLAGEEFDTQIENYFLAQIKQKHGVDIANNPSARLRLRTACEKAKIILSGAERARIEVPGILNGKDYVAQLTRAQFDNLCADLYKRAMECVNRAVKESKLIPDEIHVVVPVGGSSRIKKILAMLANEFGQEKIVSRVDADESIAFGATLLAAILNKETDGIVKETNMVLLDVCPLSLGFKIQGGVFDPLIKRNTKIPCEAKKAYTTCKNKQDSVTFDLYEGQSSMVEYNRLLGSFMLEDIPPARAGVPCIDVVFEITADGILKVSATDRLTKKEKNISIAPDKYRLKPTELREMLHKAERFEAEAQTKKEIVRARNELENTCNTIQTTLEKPEYVAAATADELKECMDLVESTIAWLYDDNNKNADKNAVVARQETLEAKYFPLIEKAYKGGATANEDD